MPLVVYNNQLLVKDNKLSTDINCCCCDDYVISEANPGTPSHLLCGSAPGDPGIDFFPPFQRYSIYPPPLINPIINPTIQIEGSATAIITIPSGNALKNNCSYVSANLDTSLLREYITITNSGNYGEYGIQYVLDPYTSEILYSYEYIPQITVDGNARLSAVIDNDEASPTFGMLVDIHVAFGADSYLFAAPSCDWPTYATVTISGYKLGGVTVSDDYYDRSMYLNCRSDNLQLFECGDGLGCAGYAITGGCTCNDDLFINVWVNGYIYAYRVNKDSYGCYTGGVTFHGAFPPLGPESPVDPSDISITID